MRQTILDPLFTFIIDDVPVQGGVQLLTGHVAQQCLEVDAFESLVVSGVHHIPLRQPSVIPLTWLVLH